MKITISHLRKEYEAGTPLLDVNVTIHEGDVISIIGPSGTGKSTLLRCLNRLEEPTSGSIYLDEENTTAPGYRLDLLRQRIGMVFQSFNLFPQKTVIENVMFAPMELKGMKKEEAREKAKELLKTVGLLDRAYRYPQELSGGQKQRVAIARTLAMDPQVILFDEPTSALDPTNVREVENVIADLAKTGRTLLIVTHEMRFARAVSNRIFFMDKGGIYEDGTPDQIFFHPKRERTRAFVEQLKVLNLLTEGNADDTDEAIERAKDFADMNRIPEEKADRMIRLIRLAFMQWNAEDKADGRKMRLLGEWNEDTEKIRIVLFTSADENFTSHIKENLPATLSNCITNFTKESIDDEPYRMKVSVEIE